MTTPARLQEGLTAFADARARHAAGDRAGAAAAYSRAHQCVPNHPEILASFASLAEEVADWTNAVRLLRALQALRPARANTLRLARALSQAGNPAEALPLLESLGDEDSVALGMRANALGLLFRWEESLACARRSWTLREDALTMESIVVALYQLARRDELDALGDMPLDRFPENWKIRSVHALHALKSRRDLERAFRFFPDIRRNQTVTIPGYDTDAAGLPWDGKPFDGVLRVTADAGLGDQILASSMFADLERTGQMTQVLCDARLVSVFSRSFPGLTFLARDKEGQDIALSTLDPQRDRRINALDLGRFFRRDLPDFPPRRAWLQVDEARRSDIATRYRQRWPDQRLAGISWHSARLVDGRADKGTSLEGFAPLLHMPRHVFVNLQYGDVAAEVATFEAAQALSLFTDPAIDATADIDGLFAQVAALDVVITASNTTAHVAGALGVPCHVLLPASRPVLWYWGYEGEHTPWYPGIRLHRCRRDGEWLELAGRVAAAISGDTENSHLG